MKKRILMMLLALSLSFVSCSLGVAYPDGRVVIKEVGERDGATGRTLVVQYALSNAGAVAMNGSTVSFSAATAARTYWFTDARSVRVLPGGTVYLSAEVDYLDGLETVDPASVAVAHMFFE